MASLEDRCRDLAAELRTWGPWSWAASSR